MTAIACTNAQKQEFTKDALDKELIASDGSKISFDQIVKQNKGKATVIEIWASWCGDCVKAMPKFKEFQSQHPEANYVFISMDKAEDKWKAGIEKYELSGAHYWSVEGMKGDFGKSIDLDWIPRYIILDKNGKIAVYRAIETDFEKMDSALNELK